MRRSCSAAAVVALGALLAAPGSAASAAPGAVGPPCASVQVTSADAPVTGRSAPLDLLGIERAQELLEARGITAGTGANVAVLDSGVYDGPTLDVAEHHSLTGRTDLVDPHGTAVAGVIAGRPDGDRPIGVAPGARIIDVRVFDTSDPESPDPTEEQPGPDKLAAGLEWVAQNADRLHIAVADVSLWVDDDARLKAAVAELWRRGVVVVASSGNRPGEGQPGSEEFGGVASPGEDAQGTVYPAAYPHVVAVNATVDGSSEDPEQVVLQNSDTAVAAPTAGLISVGVNGSYCVIDEVATSWSAAVVSGVVSMLRSAYDERPAQIVARLLETANGTSDTPTRATGYGVVQPVEALTRTLEPKRDGSLAHAVVQHEDVRATPPERPDDLLADVRDDAVWWALLGGGVLVVAVLLRPVLARRRS